MPSMSLHVDPEKTSKMRLYALLFTVLPILAAMGLLYWGGLLAKIAAVLCAAIAFHSIRANLRFVRSIEQVDDRVIVHPLWTKSSETHSNLIEVQVELALAPSTSQPVLMANYFRLVFPSGPVLVQPTAFPQAAEFVASVLKASCKTFTFPMRLGDSMLQHWGRFPDQPERGVTAGYRFADGIHLAFFIYQEEAKDNRSEFERALANLASVCSKKRLGHKVTNQGTATMAGLEFLTASLELGRGARASRSELLLTSWKHHFLKIRVTAAQNQEVPSRIIESTIEFFLRENDKRKK